MKILTNKDLIENDIISASEKTLLGDFPHHGHEFFEIELILDGDGIYEIDGTEYKIAPRTLFLMNPTNVHATRSADARIINIMFAYDPKNDMAEAGLLLLNQSPCFTLDEGDYEFLRVIFSEIVRVNESNAGYAMSLLRCALYRLDRGGSEENISIASSYVRRAVLFVHRNFASGIGLESVASHVGLTPSYFSDLFHKELGITFKAYLDDVKFSYAKKLLKYTSLPIEEIYFRSGFCDYANFARRFKQRCSMTPKEYRAAKRCLK